MEFRSFQNPDLCLPVVRRRATEYMLEFLFWFTSAALTRGRSVHWWYWYRNKPSYYTALYRLRKAGLIVTKKVSRMETAIYLTNEAHTRLPPIAKPLSSWNKKWNHIWYVLVYDVPEAQRQYRDGLRTFLSRMRMGCLQRSVWVTPRDIRPEYDDLIKATDVNQYSFLFHSETVLGRDAQDIVTSAWNFERLYEIQKWFCEVWTENMDTLKSSKPSRQTLATIAREEMSAYASAMAEDPLLPYELWPSEYLGAQVYNLHVDFIKAIKKTRWTP